MKVLFVPLITGPDYVGDAVYQGLVKILGWENVIDYPEKEAFHQTKQRDQPFHMCYFGFERHPKRELEEILKNIDVIIIGGGGSLKNLSGDKIPLLNRILTQKGKVPLIYIDGGDDPFVKEIYHHVDVYFKREVITTRYLESKWVIKGLYYLAVRKGLDRPIFVSTPKHKDIIPIPCAIITYDGAPLDRKKIYDASFIGNPTSKERIVVAKQIEKLKEEGYNIYYTFPAKLPPNEYMEITAQSRISVSARGAGYDAYKYWEIPYVGSMLLSEIAPFVIPNNFENGKEAILCDYRNIGETLKRLLKEDPKKIEEIARRGREKLMKYHTSEARARMVLEKIKEKFGIDY